jgi:pSer/pThr/pTyr-binding forkhead associated (FHA) protein/uncharacterized OB-fold protein
VVADRHRIRRPVQRLLESLMIKCSACGEANASGTSYCGKCGENLPTQASPDGGGITGGGIAGGKSTKASNRIVVSRDTQGEVSVKVVNKEGRYVRHQCRFCGRSVKVPESTVICPACGGQLGTDGEKGVEPDPAIADPRPRDPSMPLAVLYHLLPSGEEPLIPLENECSVVGRLRGIPDSLVFKRDPYLSPLHAEFRYVEEGLRVIDRDSLNGVFGQIRGPTALQDGQTLLMGEQVFRFVVLDPGASLGQSGRDGTVSLGSGLDRPGAKLVKILADGGDGPEYYLGGKRRVFGRQAGHYAFPEDLLMSQRHAVIEEVSGQFWVADLESTNGTMVRLKDADLAPGGIIRMGSQRFRVEFRK